MALLVQLSWTAANPTTGVTGYNVYLVSGAPESATKTLLAFVSGVNTTTYTYTGVDGGQYQFEVRSTDGTNESPPLEIFYPNGQALYTPTLITPTGGPQLISRDSQYITSLDFVTNYPNGLKLSTSSALYTSGLLDTILTSASGEVNRYCHRHFQTQTIDEIYQGVRIGQEMPRLITIPLSESPIQNVVRVDIQVLQWFVNISLQYLQVFPDQGFIQMVPYLGGSSGVPLPQDMLLQGILAKVWTRYTAGYDVVPNEVKLATSLFATKFIALQENPVSAQAVKFGRNFSLQWDKDNDPLVEQAHRLLDPYVVSTWRRP